MKKLSKLKLRKAVVMTTAEMKHIVGGYGDGDTGLSPCPTKAEECNLRKCIVKDARGMIIEGMCKVQDLSSYSDNTIGKVCACVS